MLKKSHQAMLSASVALSVLLPNSVFAEQVRDNFFWIGQINKASLVINTEEGLLDMADAPKFAKAIDKVLQDGQKPGAKRPQSVITFEPLLVEEAGSGITKLHAGRSSQDMLSTSGTAMLREDLLALQTAVNEVNATLLQMAEKNRNVMVPGYTNGVAAQPNSYGHYLLAFASGFDRDSERLREYYIRLDRSPMGTTVMNGTSWPLNRYKMADLLGFETIAYNAYDAVQIYTPEKAVEAGYVCTSLALHIGAFVEDVMQQYAQPHPWILLQEGGGNTYVSSAMPQKRNLGILNRARASAGTILGMANGTVYRAHNVPPGMPDSHSGVNAMVKETTKLVRDFNKILLALRIEPERSLTELNLDWTASQELADVLMRKYNVPFRVGHHFASELVGFARQHGYTPLTIPYADAQRIYTQIVGNDAASQLPMDEAEFFATMNPKAIIANRATVGGPQSVELSKMLAMEQDKLAKRQAWVKARQSKLAKAEAKLETEFAKYLK